MKKEELKPVSHIDGLGYRFQDNQHIELVLLKALSEGVTEINELRKIAGLKNTMSVIRTLDKMSIRKEYHAALARSGISLDTIVAGIKQICETSSSDKVRLGGYSILLKSLGLDKYEGEEEAAKSLEDTILKITTGDTKKLGNGIIEGKIDDDYEVEIPVMPDREKQVRVEGKELAQKLYEDR